MSLGALGLLLGPASPALGAAASAAAPAPAAVESTATAEPFKPDPDRLEAAYQFVLGKMLADRSEAAEALEAYARATELAPDDPYGWIEIAKLNSYLSQISRTRQQQITYLEAALDHIEQARELAPDNVDVLTIYAQTQMRLGGERPSAVALAQGAYERLNELEPDNPGTLTALGQIYLWNRDWEKAVDVLSEAARFHSTNRVIQGMLVEALLGTGKAEDAERALGTMIELEPENPEHRLRMAALLSERGEHAAAVEVLEPALEGDRFDGARVTRLLAREYHLAGRHQEALDLLDEHAAREATSSRREVFGITEGMLRLRTAVLSALLRYEEAIKTFEPVIEEPVTERDLRLQDALLLSRLYERVGRFDDALDLLRAQLPTVADDAGASSQLTVTLAGVLERAGRPDEALEALTRLGTVDDARTRAVAAQGRAEILEQQGRSEEASAVLAVTAGRLQAAGSEDMAAAVSLRRAMLESDAGRWDEALNETEGLVDSEEEGIRAAALRVRIDTLAAAGRVDEALGLVRSSEGLEEQERLALEAGVLFKNDRGAEAESRLLEFAGDEAERRFFAAQILQRHESHRSAATLLQGLANDEPDNVRILFSLGAALERSGQDALAAESFLRLLEQSPDHAPTLNYLGYMWAENGENLERALEMIREAVSQDPDNGAYVDSLGWVYFQLGRFEEARPHLEWAARLEPTDPTVHEHLGDLYKALGRQDSARSAYRRALEIDPEGDTAAGLRDKLSALDSEAVRTGAAEGALPK